MYFAIMKQVQPKTTVDFGMCLKRFGLIGRQFDQFVISEEVQMTGIDLMPEINANIYHKIYNEIVTVEQLLEKEAKEKVDLIFFIDIDFLLEKEKQKEILAWIKNNGKYLVTNCIEDGTLDCLKSLDLSLGDIKAKLFFCKGV